MQHSFEEVRAKLSLVPARVLLGNMELLRSEGQALEIELPKRLSQDE